MMAHHNNTGILGEKMAATYLVQKGYEILHTNWRHSHWEIDIIAVNGKKLHFIEVKTRRTATFGFPEEGVTKKKLRYIMSSAEEFLLQHPRFALIQFDILSIMIPKGQPPEYFLIEDVSL